MKNSTFLREQLSESSVFLRILRKTELFSDVAYFRVHTKIMRHERHDHHTETSVNSLARKRDQTDREVYQLALQLIQQQQVYWLLL